jgi:hypothetical protein
VINSLVDAAVRKKANSEIVDLEIVQHAAPAAPPDTSEWKDFEHELFTRLEAKAPKRLQYAIAEWRRIFQWSEKLPQSATYHHRNELRAMAEKILQELDFTVPRSDVTPSAIDSFCPEI